MFGKEEAEMVLWPLVSDQTLQVLNFITAYLIPKSVFLISLEISAETV